MSLSKLEIQERNDTQGTNVQLEILKKLDEIHNELVKLNAR